MNHAPCTVTTSDSQGTQNRKDTPVSLKLAIYPSKDHFLTENLFKFVKPYPTNTVSVLSEKFETSSVALQQGP